MPAATPVWSSASNSTLAMPASTSMARAVSPPVAMSAPIRAKCGPTSLASAVRTARLRRGRAPARGRCAAAGRRRRRAPRRCARAGVATGMRPALPEQRRQHDQFLESPGRAQHAALPIRDGRQAAHEHQGGSGGRRELGRGARGTQPRDLARQPRIPPRRRAPRCQRWPGPACARSARTARRRSTRRARGRQQP